jgi:prepilin-type N-terminal cleavage/methylation domain-containing protein
MITRFRHHGFTIVELLIVIVVIAILAAITIVAFNGVQQRARDSQRMSDLSNARKALMRWSIDTATPISGINAGAGGTATGWLDGAYSPYPSVLQVLIDGGYASPSLHDPINNKNAQYAYMITPCNASDNSTVRVLLAQLEKPPAQTVAQQLGVTCTNGNFTSYTTTYGMNYALLVSAGG